MTKRTQALRRDDAGAAAIEFAFAVPVLVSLIWGIFQISLLLEANAGMQQALGQGARLATVCTPTATGCTTASDTSIQTKITSTKFGVYGGTWSTPTITTDTTAGTKTITVSYSQPTNFLFFQGPSVTFTASKVVYLPQ